VLTMLLHKSISMTTRVWLKGFDVTTHITKGIPSFLEVYS